MKHKAMIVASVVFATSALVGFAFLPQEDKRTLLQEPEAKVQWEYKAVKLSDLSHDPVEAKFAELGRFGWEFTSTIRSSDSGQDLAIFKRVKK